MHQKVNTTNPVKLTGTLRLPFLILTPACMLTGLGTASLTQAILNMSYFWLALVGGLFAHISVNTFNEYFDFKSGLDAQTSPTPFSGGSGTLPAHPHLARSVLAIAWLSLIITGLIGAYFIYIYGIALVPLGLVGLVVILAYTPWITRHPLACLLAPGLGFGPLMVMGTDFVLTGTYSGQAFIVSLVPFFLVNNLLLLNQFPDIEADKRVGRRHYPIILGPAKSAHLYALFMLLAYLALIIGVATRLIPNDSLLGLITLPLAIYVVFGVYRHATALPKLMPFLGMNVVLNILTPVLIAIGMML